VTASQGLAAIQRGMVARGDAELACPYPAGSGLALCWDYGLRLREWAAPAPGPALSAAEWEALVACRAAVPVEHLARMLGRAPAEIEAALGLLAEAPDEERRRVA
jgi:hypothetical protein